jgi:hypothetical protein
MGKLIREEIEINGRVPQEVKDRVRANLKDREIDFSDLPELTKCPKPPVLGANGSNKAPAAKAGLPARA